MPALVGGVILAGAVAGFFATRAAENGPSTAGLQTAATARAGGVANRLDADAQALATAAATIGGNPAVTDAQLHAALARVARPDRVVAIARVATTGRPVVATVTAGGTTPPLVGFDLSSQPAWSLAFDLARDRAGPGAAVATGPDKAMAVLDALPLYGTLDAPANIGDRRTALKGFIVSVTPVTTMVGAQAASDPDISLRVSDGNTVLSDTGRGSGHAVPTSAIAAAITTNGLSWSVQAWATPTSSPLSWLVLGGGLLLALLAAGAVVSRERRIAAAVAETHERNEELALVARVGPLLQQSLELGDLLPVFVVEVGDELDLDRSVVSLVAESGELVRVFSVGVGESTPPPDLSSLGGAPTSVAPGAAVTIPLQRLGRVAGVFEARAIKGLSPTQMETLQAVCSLLAAAISNVRLFQDEQDMVARLRDVDRMKTSFIGSVSHELRTSVTAIQGFAGLLEADDDTLDAEHRADYLERISRNARSLGILVEDLLDFARFERSGLTASLRPIDLSDLVPKVAEQMSSVLGDRTLVLQIDPNVVAMADSLAIERILANLLSNAGKYTPPDSAVVVGLERDGERAVLSVTDQGPGVQPAEREKIFELFYRSDESARVMRGVGIGLALTRQLVLHLDGTIAVDDAPGGGARFRVTIPLADTTIHADAAPAGG